MYEICGEDKQIFTAYLTFFVIISTRELAFLHNFTCLQTHPLKKHTLNMVVVQLGVSESTAINCDCKPILKQKIPPLYWHCTSFNPLRFISSHLLILAIFRGDEMHYKDYRQITTVQHRRDYRQITTVQILLLRELMQPNMNLKSIFFYDIELYQIKC